MKKLAIGLAASMMLAGSAAANEAPRNAPPAAAAGLLTIYRVTGVSDNGGDAHDGSATIFSCTNITSSDASLTFQIRNSPGAIRRFRNYSVKSHKTLTVGTHIVASIPLND